VCWLAISKIEKRKKRKKNPSSMALPLMRSSNFKLAIFKIGYLP
jgi:hypothetical protein